MSAIDPTFDYSLGNDTIKVTWTPLANGDTGVPVTFADYSDRSVEFSGTFGTGGTISMQGSNVGSAYYILTDPQTSAITKTAAALEHIMEAAAYMRPIVSAGDGTTALTATMLMRRQRSGRAT
jgi:hypothetical protein